jgi:hypothetical protein
MTEPSRRERYLRALEIAERHGNRFMAANIRAELRKLDAIERDAHYLPEITDTIRRALEALPDA